MSSSFSIDASAHTAKADPREPAFFGDPYPFYAALHAETPAFVWEDYGHWCFAGWDDVNALLRDKRFGRQLLHLKSRDELGWPDPSPELVNFDAADRYSLLYLEPPDHTRLRALVNRAFVSRHVERLRPRIAQLAHELVDGFEISGEAELIEAFAAPIPVIVIAEMLGVPKHMAPQLLEWSHRMVEMYMFGKTEETERRADAAAKEFSEYVRTLLFERRSNPADDLLSHMLEADHKGQKMSEAEQISTTILLLNAGHEATVHTAGNGIKTILESGLHPTSLFATPDLAEATVEECLRFDAPLHMFTRYAMQDVTLPGGIELKFGDTVGLMLGAANRDPARFENPGLFDPHRAGNTNTSFGAGIHFCIGAPLARIELQESLKVLFERLPNLRLAESPQYRDAYHFHGLERLRAEW